MQSPRISQAVEMSCTLPSKQLRTTHSITIKQSQDQPQPKPSHCHIDKGSFVSHLNQYIRHPWGVIDYYIYLVSIESNRDKSCRAKECYLLETQGFRQINLHDDPTFDNVSPHNNVTVFFLALPVPDANNEITNTKLVLGFDLETCCLQGYLFEHTAPLENYEHLWEAWNRDESHLIIDIHIDRFLAILRYTMQHQIEILEIGMLHHYGITARPFQAGLDMVITIQLLQFIDDFAAIIWVNAEDFRGIYTPFQDELRELLLTGSRDAWFAARAGLHIEQYRQKQLKNVVASGLFYGQKIAALRTDSENMSTHKKLGSASRSVKIYPGGSYLLWPKKQIQVLVSAVLVLCFCSWIGRWGFLFEECLVEGSL